jgi:hypothetical protein
VLPAIGALSLLSLAVVSALTAGRAEEEPPPATETPNAPLHIVYYTEPSEPNSKLSILPEAAVNEVGGRVVTNEQDLYTSELNAVILDASSLQHVDTAWLAQEYREGTVLVGLNIPGQQLKEMARIDGSLPALPSVLATDLPDGVLSAVPPDSSSSDNAGSDGSYASIFWRTAVGRFTGAGFDSGQHHVDVDPQNPILLLRAIGKRVADAAGGSESGVR